MRAFLIGMILSVPVAVCAQKSYQPMDVKTGQWEVTRTLTMNGAIPIPPAAMANLSPEQRAMMEERMKAMSGERSDTQTYKSCITREQLEQGPAFDKEKRSCTTTLVTSTSSSAEVQIACDLQGMQGNGTVHVEALSREQVKGSSRMTMSGNGNTMESHATYTAKWIGPDCRENE